MDDKTLYQTILGLAEPWQVVGVELRPKEQEVWVRVDAASGAVLRCPECEQPAPRYDQAEERRWRHLDTCQYQTILLSRIPRVLCATHKVRQVRVPWAEERSRFTALFEAWALRVLRDCSLAETAELLGLSWDEAAGIQRRAVERGLARRTEEPVRVIGVDETSFQKRHEYVTVINDLERNRVLWVGDHRREATLAAYWESLSPTALTTLHAIVMDMWDPYIAATRKHVPDGISKIVFDRYHVMAHLNAAVEVVRRVEQRELNRTDDKRSQQLKGTRFLWLRGRKTRTRAMLNRIAQLQRSGLKVGRAWAIKEAIVSLWKYRMPSAALRFFQRWYGWAVRSRLPAVRKAAQMMKRYLYGILAYTKRPYTNARSEAMNAKIQEIKYRARGYRNRDNFRLAILFHCGGLNMDPR